MVATPRSRRRTDRVVLVSGLLGFSYRRKEEREAIGVLLIFSPFFLSPVKKIRPRLWSRRDRDRLAGRIRRLVRPRRFVPSDALRAAPCGIAAYVATWD